MLLTLYLILHSSGFKILEISYYKNEYLKPLNRAGLMIGKFKGQEDCPAMYFHFHIHSWISPTSF